MTAALPAAAPPTVRPRRSRDAWIPWSFVAFFLIVLAANGALLFLAFDSWTGIETEDAYRKGLAYNAALAEARAQAALGWDARLAVTTEADGQRRISVALRDASGQPVDGATLQASFVRPTHQGFDFTVDLAPRGSGRYAADLSLPLPGQWQVRLTATHRHGTYRRDERILVR